MVLEKEELVGLYPSQYKAYEIIKNSEKPLTEKEIREKWNGNHVSYTSNNRKSPVYQELKALVELGLIIKEKNGILYQYRIKSKEKEIQRSSSKKIRDEIEKGYYFSSIQINLVKTLSRLGPLPRREIVNQLRTPRTTIYDNLIKLQKKKIVEKFSKMENKRGRPIIYWKIKDNDIDLESFKDYNKPNELDKPKLESSELSNKKSLSKFMNEV